MINAMEVREGDDNFKNPVDLLFDALEEKDSDHFAVHAAAVEFGAVALVGKLGDMNVASMFVAAKMFDRRAEG